MLESLINHLRSVTDEQADVPILQPADPFLETAGEDLRRRIFLTEAEDGDLKCLRPEFTIPICLAHKSGVKRYAYGGSVFRQSRSGNNEFQQVGLEDIGNPDVVGVDAQCLADTLKALQAINVHDVKVTLGDQNLFDVVVENLNLPGVVASRLSRNFGDAHQVQRVIADLEGHNGFEKDESEAGQLALQGDETGLISHIEELMAKGGLSPNAGRSPENIAKRMIAKTRDGNFKLSDEDAQTLRKFLAIDVNLGSADAVLEEFASQAKISFGAALHAFKERVKALQDQGISLDNFSYQASFGRNLEYYSGLLFDVSFNGVTIAGGGRYDHLCELLGHPSKIPAVGFSISLDRVKEALQ